MGEHQESRRQGPETNRESGHDHDHMHGQPHAEQEHAHSHREEHEHPCEGGCECGHSHHGHGHSCEESCECGHCHHEHGGEENRSVMIGRLLFSAALLLAALFFPDGSTGRFLLSLASALAIGYDIVRGAVENLIHRELLEEMFLMTVA